MTTTTETTGLAARLREATAAEHRDTESRTFVARLMGGELDLDAYARYLAQFAHVYRALESRVPRPNDPSIIGDPRLDRYDAIVSDLAGLGVDDWERRHPLHDATISYVQRILTVSDDLPRYVGHHYTRYLGDLSGGQVIAKRLAEHYGATPSQLAFYRFDLIAHVGRFKAEYRAGLDGLDLTPDGEAALIDEAKLAFRHNADLFESLLAG